MFDAAAVLSCVLDGVWALESDRSLIPGSKSWFSYHGRQKNGPQKMSVPYSLETLKYGHLRSKRDVADLRCGSAMHYSDGPSLIT